MAVMWVNTQVKKERKTSLLQFPRGRRTTPCRGEHRGEAPGSARRERGVGRAWAEVFIEVFVGRDGKGRVSGGASLGRGS